MFTTHFAAIKKTTWIPGLSCDDDELPHRALALATAAVSYSIFYMTCSTKQCVFSSI